MFLFPIVFQPALPRVITIILFLIDFVLLLKTVEEEDRKERSEKNVYGFERHRRDSAKSLDNRSHFRDASRRNDTYTSLSLDWHSAE